MADHLVPPRRDEILTNNAIGTNRLMYYLERNAESTNEAADMIDESAATINISAASLVNIAKDIEQLQAELQSILGLKSDIARINRRLDNVELTNNTVDLSGIISRLDSIEAVGYIENLSGIQKQINELTILVN